MGILLDFYKLVKSDIPLNLLEGIIKTRVLDINNSQGVLITNKNYKINGRQTPFLNRQDFAEPHTFHPHH